MKTVTISRPINDNEPFSPKGTKFVSEYPPHDLMIFKEDDDLLIGILPEEHHILIEHFYTRFNEGEIFILSFNGCEISIDEFIAMKGCFDLIPSRSILYKSAQGFYKVDS